MLDERLEGPRIVRGSHFRMIAGREYAWVAPEGLGTGHPPDIEVVAVGEVTPFLPEPISVEVRVTGLALWVERSSAAEQADIAHKVLTWARGTAMSFSCRERWRKAGRPLDGPRWVAAVRRAREEWLGIPTESTSPVDRPSRPDPRKFVQVSRRPALSDDGSRNTKCDNGLPRSEGIA